MSEMNSLVLAALYCRLSYAPDGRVEKVERQEADCRELAKRLGWRVSERHIFKDNSKSAWRRDRKRKGWDALLEAIEAGDVNAILTYHGDRLMRQPYDLEKLIAAADRRGIRLASVSGVRNLDNADDRFILRIEVAQACRESDNTSRRVRRGIAARVVKKGLSTVGGYRPFGFGVQVGTKQKTDPETGEMIEVPVYDTTQHFPREAKLAYEAGERLLAGQSQSGVIRWLNTKCTTTQGNPWCERSFRPMITSPRMAGLIEHEGKLYRAAWDGIFPEEMWEDIKALYRRNHEQHPQPGPSRKHLLTRVALCGLCGAGMQAKPEVQKRGRRFWAYACRECKGVSRRENYVDAYVEGRVLALLNDERFVAEVLKDSDQPSVGAEIARLERRKRALAEQLDQVADDPDIDPVLAMRTLAVYDRKIVELRNQLVTSSERRLLLRMAGISREQWQRESIDVRSLTVKVLFLVVIRPTGRRGPGFDPKGVELVRRPLPESELALTGA